uniref:Uncharacterized protein n=1 Tax=Phage sp. ctIHi3 TaxID=2825791 RepID=A0A8S5Q7C1_9VIRU|nr:MAG TPA: hypothetical protein [Phage sp. ctIHi3]
MLTQTLYIIAIGHSFSFRLFSIDTALAVC